MIMNFFENVRNQAELLFLQHLKGVDGAGAIHFVVGLARQLNWTHTKRKDAIGIRKKRQPTGFQKRLR